MRKRKIVLQYWVNGLIISRKGRFAEREKKSLTGHTFNNLIRHGKNNGNEEEERKKGDFERTIGNLYNDTYMI